MTVKSSVANHQDFMISPSESVLIRSVAEPMKRNPPAPRVGRATMCSAFVDVRGDFVHDNSAQPGFSLHIHVGAASIGNIVMC